MEPECPIGHRSDPMDRAFESLELASQLILSVRLTVSFPFFYRQISQFRHTLIQQAPSASLHEVKGIYLLAIELSERLFGTRDVCSVSHSPDLMGTWNSCDPIKDVARPCVGARNNAPTGSIPMLNERLGEATVRVSHSPHII